MPDLSKYDLLLTELSALESQVTLLKDKYVAVSSQNKELDEEITILKKENFSLEQKLNRIENEAAKAQNTTGETEVFSSLNKAEKKDLKNKIQTMISKIDHHLSS
ncbi:MAG: hypothetical protein K8H86_10950 [Ignavibacteriaceae bacterium]|nr:hypothetical protein [Ignavibacteriaceae bacterium]